MGALLSLLASRTFLSAVLSIVASILCNKAGVPIDPTVTAAVPLAVGVKEAGRRYGEGVAAAALANASGAREAALKATLDELARAAGRLGREPRPRDVDERELAG